MEEYLRMVVNHEEERCPLCYRMRLEETARKAREKGIENISTTLLISPYQKHDLLKDLGEKIAGSMVCTLFIKTCGRVSGKAWPRPDRKGFICRDTADAFTAKKTLQRWKAESQAPA